MASTKGDDNSKKKTVTSASGPSKNMHLSDKESGLLMAIASALGDAPQVDYEAVNKIVGMTYTKNVKSAARKLFVKLGDPLTFCGGLNKHETALLSAIALISGGAPGLNYDLVAQAVGMLHGKSAKTSAKVLFEKLAAIETPSTLTFLEDSASSSARDAEEGQTPARATRNTPAKQNMSAKRGIGPRPSIKVVLKAKSKKPSASNDGQNSKDVPEKASANVVGDDDLYDDDGGMRLRTSQVQGKEPAAHGDDDGGEEDYHSADKGSVGTLGGNSDQLAAPAAPAVFPRFWVEIPEYKGGLEPGPSTAHGQEEKKLEKDGNEIEPHTPDCRQDNTSEHENDTKPEPSPGFQPQSARAITPQASMNEEVDLANLVDIVKNAAEIQAIPPPQRPIDPPQQVVEHNYMVQDPEISSLVVTPFRHPPQGPIPGIYTVQVLGHLHPVTQNDVEMAAWYNISIEVYMEWRLRNNISAYVHNA